ncbi:MAG: thiolase family protein [Proteobacteria bacterium]|nr:thiolase family protein [Pseudomonadota bacterium]MBU1738160.1 thiolase family protein [Pseudomonadota bacterium]
MKKRIAIVGGVRTPYVKAGTRFADLSAVDLGRLVSRELIARTGIDPSVIDSVVIGNVSQPMEAVNIARVISIFAGIPEHVPAYTVHRNCASGIQAIVSGAQSIATGESEVVLAGGVESMSNIPFFLSKKFHDIAVNYLHSKSLKRRLLSLLELRPKDFIPKIGLMLGLTDPTCRLNMGQTAEVLARELGVSRESQDEFALESHKRTVAAYEAGRFKDEIMTVFCPPDYQESLDFDNGARADESMEILSRLRPFFDRKYGTVTAGNSSQITDGAAAVMLASGKAVKKYGLEPLGYVGEYAFAGLSPKRMGLGPAYATSRLLEKSGLALDEIGLIEMNEAFAAQIIANEMVFAQDQLAEHYLGRKAMGAIDRSIMNVNGGAIAMGHPVGSSGTRLVLTLLLEMRRRGVGRGLATLCVGGGQGAAVIIERT